jgi:hypothetical protein
MRASSISQCGRREKRGSRPTQKPERCARANDLAGAAQSVDQQRAQYVTRPSIPAAADPVRTPETPRSAPGEEGVYGRIPSPTTLFVFARWYRSDVLLGGENLRDVEIWWSCRGTAPRVRNRKPKTSQASRIWPCGTLTGIALPVCPAGSLFSLEPWRQRANVRYLSRACSRRVTAGMGGLPVSPRRPGSARTCSRWACARGPTGWRVLEC